MQVDDLDVYNKNKNKILRNIFSRYIKSSFLIRVESAFVNKYALQLRNLYPDKFWVGSILPLDCEIDICRHIVGLHRSNMIFKTHDEVTALENDPEYVNRLINETYVNVSLREYGSAYFRSNPIVPGDIFICYHFAYYLAVITQRIRSILIQHNKDKNELFTITSLIMEKSLAVLSLLEDNLYDSAYSLCRSILELFIKYLVLRDNINVIKLYDKFDSYDLQRTNCGGDYPSEFLDLFNHRKNTKFTNKVDYILFGWVDGIKDYHVNITGNPYCLNGLIEYLSDSHYDSDELDLMMYYYKECNGYVHSNINKCKYKLLNYFEITTMLSLCMATLYSDTCLIYKEDNVIDGIDILDKLDSEQCRIFELMENKSTENFEIYNSSYY